MLLIRGAESLDFRRFEQLNQLIAVADLERIGPRATNVQHQPCHDSRCECPFSPAGVDGINRMPVDLGVLFVDAATTVVLHGGCNRHRNPGFGEAEASANAGEEGLRHPVSITWKR
jgi:hypothetical protein